MTGVWCVVCCACCGSAASLQGEAALFGDVKAADDEGHKFTTAVSVVSPTARLLRLHINHFYPLVYHQHPGATAIVQRLGRIMVRGRLSATRGGIVAMSSLAMVPGTSNWF